MLARYRIHRGRRPADDPLPDGVRQDTRKHTRHALRPEPDMVARALAGDDEAWRRFRDEYEALLERRFADDRGPFDELARLAAEGDVFIGCSCPSRANPETARCHTVLALRFMKRRYPALRVVMPAGVSAR